METFDVSSPRSTERAQKVLKLFQSCSNPMLAKILSHGQDEHNAKMFNIVTEKGTDEMSVAEICSSGKSSQAFIIYIFENMCSLIDSMTLVGVDHGAVHEINVYYSPIKKQCYLRDFMPESNMHADVVSNETQFFSMVKRLAASHAIPLILYCPSETSSTLKEISCALSRLRHRQLVKDTRYAQSFVRELLPDMIIRLGEFRSFQVETSSHAALVSGISVITDWILRCKPTVYFPLFFPVEAAMTRGNGPCVQILNEFFLALVSHGVFEYQTSIHYGSRYAWPVSPINIHSSLILPSRSVYVAAGMLLVYARMMNFTLDVDFSPALVHMLVVPQEKLSESWLMTQADVAIMRPITNVISSMMSGAAGLRMFMIENRIDYNLLCHVARARSDISVVISALAFCRESVSNAQRGVFVSWIRSVTKETRERFLFLVTGARRLNPTGDKILISASRTFEYNVCTCGKTITLPECVLSSVSECAKFFDDELFKTDISVFNGL